MGRISCFVCFRLFLRWPFAFLSVHPPSLVDSIELNAFEIHWGLYVYVPSADRCGREQDRTVIMQYRMQIWPI